MLSAEFSSTSPGKGSLLSAGWQGEGYVRQRLCKDKPATGGFLRCSAEVLLCSSGPQVKNNDCPPYCWDHFKVSLPQEASTSPVWLVGKLTGDANLEGDACMERCLGGTSALVYSVRARLREAPHSSSYLWPLQCSWHRGTLREASEQETCLFSLWCYREACQAGEIWLEIYLERGFLADASSWGMSMSVAWRAIFSFPQQRHTLHLQLVIF